MEKAPVLAPVLAAQSRQILAAPVQGQILARPRVAAQAQVKPLAQVEVAPLALVEVAPLALVEAQFLRVFGSSIELAVRQFEISG